MVNLIKSERELPAVALQRNCSVAIWNTLKTSVFPGAQDESIAMVLDYCSARKLDPMKKPVHIVPVYSRAANGYVDTIWPGISEIRTTAMRTGEYAGKTAAEFGDTLTEKWGNVEVRFPEWAQMTVFRVVRGGVREFCGPRVYWRESYASVKGGAPNAMWQKRPVGQLEKCAEAAALRTAFPEEVGSQYSAEEMHSQAIDVEATYTGDRPGTPDREAGAATTHDGEKIRDEKAPAAPAAAPAKKSARRTPKKKPDKAAAGPEKKAADPPPPPPPPPPTDGPIVLEEGKTYENLRCNILALKSPIKHPSGDLVGLKLEGDFVGPSYDTEFKDPYPYKEGDTVMVTIYAQKSKKPNGVPIALIRKIDQAVDF